MPSFEAILSEINAILDLNDEEIPEEDRERIDLYLDELAKAEADKVDSFALVCRMIGDRIEATKNLIGDLQAKKKTMENKLTWLKGYYLSNMEKNGLKKIQGNSFSISTRKSQSVEIHATSEDLQKDLDHKYLRITVEPNKTEIKKALTQGLEIPHCKLIEHNSLMIR